MKLKEQDNTEQDSAGQGRPGLGTLGQVRTEKVQARTGLGSTGQDRTL